MGVQWAREEEGERKISIQVSVWGESHGNFTMFSNRLVTCTLLFIEIFAVLGLKFSHHIGISYNYNNI
jgi:hypothetical protein